MVSWYIIVLLAGKQSSHNRPHGPIGAALITVSTCRALSQTPAYAAKPRIRGLCIARRASLTISGDRHSVLKSSISEMYITWRDISALSGGISTKLATNIHHWIDKWQMDCNVSKCKVIHVGKTNRKKPYYVRGNARSGWSRERLGLL